MSHTKKSSVRAGITIVFDRDALKDALASFAPSSRSLRQSFQALIDAGVGVKERTLYKAAKGEPIDEAYATRISSKLGFALEDLAAKSDSKKNGVEDVLTANVAYHKLLMKGVSNPYPGLMPYDETRSQFFFGRDRELDTIVDLCEDALSGKDERTISVEGMAGVGKSSIILSGAIPRLIDHERNNGKRIAISLTADRIPTSEQHFIRNIWEQLQQAGIDGSNSGSSTTSSSSTLSMTQLERDLERVLRQRDVVVFVDAFEAVALTPQRIQFHWLRRLLNAIREYSAHTCIIVAQRTKSNRVFDQALEPSLPEWAGSHGVHRYPLTEMSYESLREALLKPFAAFGVEMDTGTTEMLIATTFRLFENLEKQYAVVADTPLLSQLKATSALPLISMWLTLLFERKFFGDEISLQGGSFDVNYSQSAELSNRFADSHDPNSEEDDFSDFVLEREPERLIEMIATKLWESLRLPEHVSIEDHITGALPGLISARRIMDGGVAFELCSLPEPIYGSLRSFLPKLEEYGLIERGIDGYRFTHIAVPLYWSLCVKWLFESGSSLGTGNALLLEIDRIYRHACDGLEDKHHESLDYYKALQLMELLLPISASRTSDNRHGVVLSQCQSVVTTEAAKVKDSSKFLLFQVPGTRKGTQVIHLLSAYDMFRNDSENAATIRHLQNATEAVEARRESDGRTALAFAAWSSSAESIRTLIKYGADPWDCEHDRGVPTKWCPVSIAAYADNTQALNQMLAESPVEDDSHRKQIIQFAARVAIHAHSTGALRSMCEWYWKEPRLFLDSDDNHSLLSAAAIAGSTACVDVLLERESIREMLLSNEFAMGESDESSSRTSAGRNTALHIAAEQGNAELLIEVLAVFSEEWSVNCSGLNGDAPDVLSLPNADGMTPLMCAAANHQDENIELLWNSDEDALVRNDKGLNALDYACTAHGGNENVVVPSGTRLLQMIESLKAERSKFDTVDKLVAGHIERLFDLPETHDTPEKSTESRGSNHTAPVKRLYSSSKGLFREIISKLVATQSKKERLASLSAAVDSKGNRLINLIALSGLGSSETWSLLFHDVDAEIARDLLVESKTSQDSPLSSICRRADLNALTGICKSVPVFSTDLIRNAALSGKDSCGRTLLHQICLIGDVERIERCLSLLNTPADLLEEKDAYGRKPGDCLPAKDEFKKSVAMKKLRCGRWRPKSDRTSWDEAWTWSSLTADELADSAQNIKGLGACDSDEALVAWLKEESEFSEASAVVESIAIGSTPFYKADSVRVLRVELSIETNGKRAEKRTAYRLISNENTYRVDGASKGLHSCRDGGIDLPNPTERGAFEKYREYLVWFCYAVHGEEGPFMIVESEMQTEVQSRCQDEKTFRMLKAYVGAVKEVPMREPHRDDLADGQAYICMSAIVWYSFALFEAEFLVYQNGIVDMLDDQPLCVGLRDSTKQWFF